MANTMTVPNPGTICAGIKSPDPMPIIVAETVSAILDQFRRSIAGNRFDGEHGARRGDVC